METTEDTRLEKIQILGTLQINIGIFHLFLGILWFYLYMTQYSEFLRSYKTLALNAKYPFISALLYIISGTLTLTTQRKLHGTMAKVAMGMDSISIVYSAYGLTILIIEFLNYDSEITNNSWPESAGKLLSDYLFFYSVLYIVISWMILTWTQKIIFSSS